MMPSHPPERSIRDGYAWDLQQLIRLDELGFDEASIGEHFTAPWEPNPAPDLLIAQAWLQTERIKLCPGAQLLPYHHPVELAHRVAYLDHLAEGRYMFGVGISALPSDLQLFEVDGAERSGRTHARNEWRLVRDIFVAPTDEEARRRASEGAMGRCWREYLLPCYVGSGFGAHFKRDAAEPDSALDVD